MNTYLLVAAGGALGAMARYGVSSAALKALGPGWPYGTFAANVVGGLLMGVLAGWFAFRGEGGQDWRLFLGTGVLGGFTTFSAFSLETALMIERKAFGAAAGYALGSVVLAVMALFAGLYVARRVFS